MISEHQREDLKKILNDIYDSNNATYEINEIIHNVIEERVTKRLTNTFKDALEGKERPALPLEEDPDNWPNVNGREGYEVKDGKIKKRSAFTMIELIFVIVILGILAAVAIPKLAATRSDAKISTCIQETTQFLSELSTYSTSHNGVASDISIMTNIPKNSFNGDTNDFNLSNKTITYLCDGNAAIKFIHTQTGADNNITVEKADDADGIGLAVFNALSDKDFNKTYELAGSHIVY